MENTVSKLTVYFEEPFWIGVFERECGGKYEACRVVFGAEPRDYEVYEFLLKHWAELRFGGNLRGGELAERQFNPKTMRRKVRKQMQSVRVGTKAQQALKQQQEQGKQQRSVYSREQREADKERKFSLRQQKRHEKHRGH